LKGLQNAASGVQQRIQARRNPMSTTTPETITGTDDTAAPLPEHEVQLSDVAAGKVRSLLEQEGRTDLRLRVAVQPGGCSGLIYQLYFDERILDGDAVRDFDGVEVIVDKMSVPYLSGASIDFEDTISKQGFTIDNPNAGGSCACGDSFH
jgi:iron-sulfur cluster assembly accessory protein